MPNHRALEVVIVSAMAVSNSVVLGARFRDFGDLLKIACSTEYSAADSYFRWLVLLSSQAQVPRAMLAALKNMECRYEVRTIEAVSQWNASEGMPHVDYKVIALGIQMADLRRALNVYVS